MSHDWSGLHSEAEHGDGWTDEEAYEGWIKEHRFLTSKNLWADLSKFLSEIWSSLSQIDRIGNFFKGVAINISNNRDKSRLEWSSQWNRALRWLNWWRSLCREQVLCDLLMSIRLVTRTYFLNLSTNSSNVTSTWSPVFMSFKLYFLDLISSSPRTIT